MAGRNFSVEEVLALLDTGEDFDSMEPVDDPHEVIMEGSDEEFEDFEADLEDEESVHGKNFKINNCVLFIHSYIMQRWTMMRIQESAQPSHLYPSQYCWLHLQLGNVPP